MASSKSSYAITLVITRLKLSIPLHRNGIFEMYIVLHVSPKVTAFQRRQLTYKKARDSKKDPYLAIIAYLTAPLISCELSPLELCMSRRLRSNLPCTNERSRQRVQIFDKLWKSAVINDQHSNRSYILQTHDGNVYRRNRKFILKSKYQTHENIDLMPLLKYPEKSCAL